MTKTGTDDVLGTLIGERFRLRSLLGSGGMASVYLAADESLGRDVAVKIFRPDLADAEDLQRQQEEIQLLASLNHPSLVTLFDAATDPTLGYAYIVMELVRGDDLRTRLQVGPLEEAEVAAIGQHLADALAYVHTRGVIHRDIKPANILLPVRDVEHTGPRAKLADFGIARIVDGSRLTATGIVLGTATYLSPEQALGEGVTIASDVYSLGLVLLESLTGVRAFSGTPAESMVARVTRDPDIPDSLGTTWVSLLRSMTSRDAAARPTSREVSQLLAGVIRETRTDNDLDDQEPLAATRAYPVTGFSGDAGSTSAATEVMASAAPRQETRPSKLQPALTSQPTPPIRKSRPRLQASTRRLAIIGAAVLSVVAAVLVIAWLISNNAAPTAEPAPTYPAVDGQLGTGLKQLQRSVEP
ncbi:MAG: protein kinase [Homoserinimonas sp.]|nr:protein kinase [Homoserinimonas sp.]